MCALPRPQTDPKDNLPDTVKNAVVPRDTKVVRQFKGGECTTSPGATSTILRSSLHHCIICKAKTKNTLQINVLKSHSQLLSEAVEACVNS